MMAKNNDDDQDDQLANAEQEFEKRQATRDADSEYIKQALSGSPTAAIAHGDQAKAALKDEQALKKRNKPPKHRK